MLKIKKVLYPTDFSEAASHALPFAVSLAEQYEAELHMLHALVLHADDPGNVAHRFPNIEELYESLHKSAEERLGTTAEEHVSDDLEVHRAQQRGIAAPGVILDYVEEHEIDVIVLGTHGRRGLRRLLLGSVAEEVVRLAPCPVLTVRERAETEATAKVDNLIVPIDFSEHSKLALRYAAELARQHGARIQLLHIVEETVYPDFYLPVLPSGDIVTEKLTGQAETRLQELAGEAADGVECETFVKAGRAAHEIASFAKEQEAEMIVIASHGLTGLTHVLLGSVTESVVRRADCPVLTVKAFGKKLL